MLMTDKSHYHNLAYPHLALDDLRVGDRVRLLWNGYHRVPLFLTHTWATIEGLTQAGLLIVRPDAEDRVRRIRREEDVCAVMLKEDDLRGR